jgi:hypothetical protein
MADPRALVKNAADPKQVGRATRKERDARAVELADLRAVLNTEYGRRSLWRLLTHCSVFESIFSASSLIYANAGRQDVGHFLMAEIEAADPEAIFRMMREHKVRQQRENAETDASQTPSSQEQSNGN